MGVPKQRHTKSKRNKRRMHLFIKPALLASCRKCGQPVRPHVICWNCGHYKGEEVINVLERLDKKERKKREKEMAAQEKEKPLDAASLSKQAGFTGLFVSSRIIF